MMFAWSQLNQFGKVLGHLSPRTTQIYARLTDDTARRALEGHADRLLSVLQASGAVDPGLPPGQA
jgi:hypothetical protein